MSEMNPVTLRLLLAEDSEEDAELLLRELGKGGFQVSVQRVDNEAAFRAALRSERWDAVITDYHLSGVDAPSLLRVLREQEFAGPVIAISGALSEEQLVDAMRAGAHDFIQKGRLARL